MRPFRALTTLQTVLIAGVGGLAGIAIVALANTSDWIMRHLGLQAVLNNLGGAIIVSFALAALWELVGKRAFAREILETARMSADVETSGLIRVGVDYLQDPDWDDLFRSAQKLDVFFSYGRTWRNSNRRNLDMLASRPGGEIRLALPDPHDEETVRTLSDRFNMDRAQLVSNIEEACTDFLSLRRTGGASIEVYYRRGDAVFTYYRLDDKAVVVLYSHKRERVFKVPTIVCRAGGSLYEFLHADFESIIKQGVGHVDETSGREESRVCRGSDT